MKKLIIIVVIFLLGIVIFRLFIPKRTPERLLEYSLNISLKNFDYKIEKFEDHWLYNLTGDGHVLIIFKFNKLTQDNIDYLKGFGLKTLPISEEVQKRMWNNMPPNEFQKSVSGYYIYKRLSEQDIRDFKIFIVDTLKQTAVLYYQYE